MTKIKVAFVGAGYMTTEHMKAFSDIEEVVITGICSKTRERAEKLAALYPGTIVCDTIDELYGKTKADIIVVSVPELIVAELASQCFRYPWICLFEKPLGLNVNESKQINAEAKQTHSKVFVLLNRRQYSSTDTVLKDLEDRSETRLIQVQDQEDIKVQTEKGVSKLLTDNWMYANAIHIIDYFTFLGRGEISTVENLIPWNPANPGYVSAKINYVSGDIGLYTAIWNAPAPWSVAVTTASRRWELKPLEQAAYQDYRSRAVNPVVSHEWDTQFKPGLRKQAQQAINFFKGEEHALPTLDDAMETMELIHTIYGV